MITCKFEDGGNAELRHVVVDGIILNAAHDSILLTKRAPHLTNGGKYGLIGGYLDRDETCELGMLRELMEETGYEGRVIELFKVVDTPNRRNEDRQNVTFVYIVEAGDKVGEPDDESTEIRWHNLNGMPREEEFAFDHYEIITMYLKARTGH